MWARVSKDASMENSKYIRNDKFYSLGAIRFFVDINGLNYKIYDRKYYERKNQKRL